MATTFASLARPVVAGMSLLTCIVAAACRQSPPAPAPPASTTGRILAATLADSPATGATQAADDLRSAWYSNQPDLAPEIVEGRDFGRLFSRRVEGQVYAQPLVSSGILLVATEANHVYALDPGDGHVLWEVGPDRLGLPFDPQAYRNEKDKRQCMDLVPTVGITGTPVVDPSSGVAYLVAKTSSTNDCTPAAGGHVEWCAHALDLGDHGRELQGFPVRVWPASEKAATLHGNTVVPENLSQRSGLLLLGGVVYAAFGAMCDLSPWTGWVVGVPTTGKGVRTRWSTETGAIDGAGVWQSGGGLVSDGPGRIFLATGNANDGGTPKGGGQIPSNRPPPHLGESVVRLQVEGDGTLRAVDFFSPADADKLDGWDADLGSCGPVGLPSGPGLPFGTDRYPHLLIQVGKLGEVYLLDRDHLGGVRTGPGDTDAVVAHVGPYGGVWSKAALWPGDGGYVYIPTASDGVSAGGSAGYLNAFRYVLDGKGNPTLHLAGRSPDELGFGSSSPVVTSQGTSSGTALVWVVRSPSHSGDGAELRAYDAVPREGSLRLRFKASVGQASKFNPPGVSNGRVYVGTRDGHVIGFGHAPGRGCFNRISWTSKRDGQLEASPGAWSFVPTSTSDGERTATVMFSNVGDAPLTVEAVDTSDLRPPFSVTGVPNTGTMLGPGQSLAETFTFAPRGTGSFDGGVALKTSAGTLEVRLFGDGVMPGHLALGETPGAPTATCHFDDYDAERADAGPTRICDFGEVTVGTPKALSFTVTNRGGTTLTIFSSKPPLCSTPHGGTVDGGDFCASPSFGEDRELCPGESLTEEVSFSPTKAGPANPASWKITTAGENGSQTITFTGVGKK
jgi:iron transport multicopper oxidase